MGRKKILIGSIFVLALILLMPSIPAIEQKTIEDKAYSDFIEKIKDVDLEDISDIEWNIFPRLMQLLWDIFDLRFDRGDILMMIVYVIFQATYHEALIIYYRSQWLMNSSQDLKEILYWFNSLWN